MSHEISRISSAIFIFALGLSGCGGGASNSDIQRQQAECASGVASSCALLNQTGSAGQQTSAATALFTTAPSAITLASGGSATYSVGGGKAPYTATSSNTSVVTTALSGAALTISSIAAGSAPIVVVDSAGKPVTVNVTVLAKGQTGVPPSIFPASITAGNCTTNIPFVFTGGTAPFTILTSDIFRAPVSAPLRFGSDSYFMASLNSLAVVPPSTQPLPGPAFLPWTAVLTVLDSQSRTATATITVPSSYTCPWNSLLQIVSGSQNAHMTEKVTFQIAGGVPGYSVTSSDENIAKADLTAVLNSSTGTYSFDVRAISTGTDPLNGTALITVTSGDLQKANIVFTVFPPPQLP